MVVSIEDSDGELVPAQIALDVFDWIEFGRIGRRVQERHVVRHGKPCCSMVSGAIEHENGVAALGDLAPDLGKVLRHRLGICVWHDESCGRASGGTDGAEDVAGFTLQVRGEGLDC